MTTGLWKRIDDLTRRLNAAQAVLAAAKVFAEVADALPLMSVHHNDTVSVILSDVRCAMKPSDWRTLAAAVAATLE
jgi:hypothetical protein